MDVDRRIAAARRRIHDGIDDHAAAARAELVVQRIDNAAWVDARTRFYTRSIGQIIRHNRKVKA
jgi:hypothetical protein